jgi:hypothetical protein
MKGNGISFITKIHHLYLQHQPAGDSGLKLQLTQRGQHRKFHTDSPLLMGGFSGYQRLDSHLVRSFTWILYFDLRPAVHHNA